VVGNKNQLKWCPIEKVDPPSSTLEMARSQAPATQPPRRQLTSGFLQRLATHVGLACVWLAAAGTLCCLLCRPTCAGGVRRSKTAHCHPCSAGRQPCAGVFWQHGTRSGDCGGHVLHAHGVDQNVMHACTSWLAISWEQAVACSPALHCSCGRHASGLAAVLPTMWGCCTVSALYVARVPCRDALRVTVCSST
jgi:hypothetical protein